jgi:hypothetical protein
MTDNTSDTNALHEQLAAHRHTLAILLRQLAEQSPTFARPELFHGISFARTAIAQLKDALRAQGYGVEDVHGDLETPAEQVAARRSRTRRSLELWTRVARIFQARGACRSPECRSVGRSIDQNLMARSREACRGSTFTLVMLSRSENISLAFRMRDPSLRLRPSLRMT